MARAKILFLLLYLGPCVSAARAGGQERRCQALLEKLWQATLPARQALGIEQEPRLRDGYGKREGFLERCRTLAADEIDCLENIERPQAMFTRCLERAGRPPAEFWRAPSLLGLLDEQPAAGPAYPPEQLARLLEGVWRNRWAEGRSSISWRINRRGRIAETRLGPDGASIQRHLLIAGGAPGQLAVDAGDGRQERWPWLRLGPRRMIVGRHLPHAVMGPWSGGRARLRYDRLLLLVEEERCRVISDAGALAPAECRWERDKIGRRLTLEFRHPETDAAGRAVFYLLADHLLEEKLVRSGLFEKK